MYESLLKFLDDIESEHPSESGRLRERQATLVRNFRKLKWPISGDSVSLPLLLNEAEMIFSTVNTAGEAKSPVDSCL